MVHTDDRPPVRMLRMEHGKVQALDLELLEAIDAAFARADADDVGALVLTGTGRAFSAGVDLFRLVDGGADYVERFLPLLTEVLLRLFACPRPLVTAVNGHAIAGGALIAWCGDLRVMASGTGRIGIPEVRVGVPFPVAPLEIARFACGARLSSTVFRADTWDPGAALAHGLVDETVAPDALIARATEVAAGLASVPREVFGLTKSMVREPVLSRIRELRHRQDLEVHRVWASRSTLDRVRDYLARTVGR
jgi:enoyl-CoA hydratase